MKRIIMILFAVLFSLEIVVATGTKENVTTGGAKKNVSGAQLDWPKQAINLVVPFAAGGNSDFNARVIAKYLTKELGQPVIITNVAGSGGTIGASQVKNAKPDGYTVLVHQISINMAQVCGIVDFGYADFEPVCVFSRASDEVLLINAKVHPDWNTFEDVIAATKKEPGKYKLTANTGASTQWIALAIQDAGAQFNVVSSGGSGERLQLLLGNHVDVIPLNYNMVIDYLKTGQFRMIANVSEGRSTILPDVPTLKEKGVACGYSYDNTFFMPKGTDKAIVNKFAAACEKIITTNGDYQKELEGLVQVPLYKGPAETAAEYKQQLADLMKIQDKIRNTK